MAEDLRDRAIPRRDHAPTALDYKAVPVDLTDPRSREPLVDLADYGISGHGYYARIDGLNAPYGRAFKAALVNIWCRQSVAARLVEVNRALSGYGAELFVMNGFRPIALQEELWAYFLDQAKNVLDDPDEESCIAFAGEYCSDPRRFDPSDSQTWPVHVTGGAVDTALRVRGSGETLFMGGIFDEPTELSHTSHFEKRLITLHCEAKDLPASDQAALRNRRLLYWAMTEAGFANYAYEWWHYDWGTQLWALESRSGQDTAQDTPVAWYGPAEAPV